MLGVVTPLLSYLIWVVRSCRRGRRVGLLAFHALLLLRRGRDRRLNGRDHWTRRRRRRRVVAHRGSDSVCSGFGGTARHRHGPHRPWPLRAGNRLFTLDLLGRLDHFDLFFRHWRHLGEEELFQGLRHDDDILAGLVVDVAVGEDRVKVLDAFLGRPVTVVINLSLISNLSFGV